MRLSEVLAVEWRPALGCTEPAAIAWAAALAASRAGGEPRAAHLSCDPRIFKNCHAVGIPHSGGRTGILWALAIGASLPDATGQLECFRRVDGAVLTRAEGLLRAGAVTVEVDPSPRSLLVDCRVVSSEGVGRARIEDEHTRVVRLERDGVPADVGPDQGGPVPPPLAAALREDLAGRTFEELVSLARSLEPGDAALLRRGVAMNLTIAQHGLSLFPRRFFQTMGSDGLSRLSRLVCAGVYARMSGADDTVMSLAGSGNKGITASVPLALWGEDNGHPPERVEEALALACLVTSATTHRLGTLSAVCGCSNAAGIGLAAGLVHLEGGSPAQLALAMNNMVGNVTGMICDGAKIGCALKTMTSVDAAFRAASLALSGMGIPETDGIVGRDGEESLRNLGRIATHGMVATDGEILRILQDKLRAHPST